MTESPAPTRLSTSRKAEKAGSLCRQYHKLEVELPEPVTGLTDLPLHPYQDPQGPQGAPLLLSLLCPLCSRALSPYWEACWQKYPFVEGEEVPGSMMVTMVSNTAVPMAVAHLGWEGEDNSYEKLSSDSAVSILIL